MEPGIHVATAVIASPLTPSWRHEVRTIATITEPIAAGFLAEMAMNFSDTLIIGRVVGGIALGAVSLSAQVLFSLLFACMGVISVVGAFAAQSRGAGDPVALALAIRQGFWVATMLSLPAMVIGWYLPTVLRWCGQDAESGAAGRRARAPSGGAPRPPAEPATLWGAVRIPTSRAPRPGGTTAWAAPTRRVSPCGRGPGPSSAGGLRNR